MVSPVRAARLHQPSSRTTRTGDTYDGVAYPALRRLRRVPRVPPRTGVRREDQPPDEQTMLDMSKIVVLFTEAPEQFIP